MTGDTVGAMPGLGGGAGPSSAAAAQAGRLLPFVVAAIAVYEACIQLVPWVLHPDRWVFPWRIYNLAILAPNYLENGFVRRGLGGTILMLLDGRRTLHPPGSLAAFHLATAIFFALPMALLLRRLAVRGDRQWLWFAVVVLVSPQMFRSWATDVGRTDMLTCGFIAWSLLLALDRRFVLAAVVLFVGSLAHETAIFFGVPLLAATWYAGRGAAGSADRRRFGVAAAVLGILLVAAALAQHLFGDGPREIARTIHAGGPTTPIRDLAAYMTVAGLRSIVTATCISRTQLSPVVALCGAVVVLALYANVLLVRSWRTLALLAFVSVLPLLVLSAVANDYGRWTTLAVTAAWLAAVALRLIQAEPVVARPIDYIVALALLAVLFGMRLASISYPNVATKAVAERLSGAPSKTLFGYATACDPDWRALVARYAAGAP